MHAAEALELSNIQEGEILAQVNELITRAARDVIERPTMAGKRTVTLTIDIEPDKDAAAGMFACPTIDWSAGLKTPGKKGRVTRGFIEDGVIKVNTRRYDEPLQTTIDDSNITQLGGKK